MKREFGSENDIEENLRPQWISKELIAETLRVWKPRYQGKLTEQGALEILLSTMRLIKASTWSAR